MLVASGKAGDLSTTSRDEEDNQVAVLTAVSWGQNMSVIESPVLAPHYDLLAVIS